LQDSTQQAERRNIVIDNQNPCRPKSLCRHGYLREISAALSEIARLMQRCTASVDADFDNYRTSRHFGARQQQHEP
jgi:hypothetical protein